MSITKIKAGIIGAAGYTGGELIRLLINHPYVEISFLQSRSNAGNNVAAVHTDLEGDTDMLFTEQIKEADVIFFCAGHGEAVKLLNEHEFSAATKLIDVGNDFRLKKDAVQGDKLFVYGLPEAFREDIKMANNVANPGCFATTVQLGLLPLAKLGLLSNVYSTGITGSTGAGQSLSATSHFSWRANNVQAYKTLTHQHLGEIGETLSRLQNNVEVNLRFVPWRGDFTRGIFVSSQFQSEKPVDELENIYRDYYSAHPFVTVSKKPVHLKQVVNTNKVMVQIEKSGHDVVIHSCLDNLLKGAVGQAVQNMNLMFGLDEVAGLRLKASGY